MKILMISWEYPPVVIGGLGRHVHHLSTALAEAGHDVVVLSRRPTGTDPSTHPSSDEVHDGVRVIAAAQDPHEFTFGSDMMAWTLAMGHSMIRAGLGLACSDASQREGCVEWIRGRDDNGINLRIIDQGHGIIGNTCCTCCIRHRPRALLVCIADHLQAGAWYIFGEEAGVVCTHNASANQANAYRHAGRPPKSSV